MNIDEAKEYFMSMGCSHFHMQREYPERYANYRGFEISNDQENIWRLESIIELQNKILNKETNKENLWCMHSSMARLTCNHKSLETLEIMLNTTESIKSILPPRGMMLVGETIIGRGDYKSRDGLIFLSLDLQQKKTAYRFSQLALDLCSQAKDMLKEEIKRCDNAVSKINHIIALNRLKNV